MYYLQALHNTTDLENVEIDQSDSRDFLSRLSGTNVGEAPLFYLDSHWEQNLPLKNELEIIKRSFPNSTIVIDDFSVPDDPGYGWDDYGDAGSLELDYLKGQFSQHYKIYFPTLQSSAESGAMRGCCVISRNSIEVLDQLSELKGGFFEYWNDRVRQKAQPNSALPDNNEAHIATTSIDSGSYPDQIRGLNLALA